MKTHWAAISWLILGSISASAQTADEFLGNWASSDGEGIVKIERCSLFRGGTQSALCATVVWDKSAKDPELKRPHDCYRLVGQFNSFSDSTWSDGMSYDPRTTKSYRAKLRLKEGKLYLRSYIGNEMFGETEMFSRVDKVPNDCEIKIAK